MTSTRAADPIPWTRVRAVNDAPARPDGDYVLYWMIAARRTRSSFPLQHAVAQARKLGRPLLVFEALRAGYRWASDRLHRFVMDGMEDNAAACANAGVRYLSYLERKDGDGKGLLEKLADRAALVVTDDFPCFFLPRMVAAAGDALPVRLEAVDGNGLLPLSRTDGDFTTAHSFRRYLQKQLPAHLLEFPVEEPLRGARGLGEAVVPRAALDQIGATPALSDIDIDHDVAPVDGVRGGPGAGSIAVTSFLDDRLSRYANERNQPLSDAASGLSAWLHFGHVSPHEVCAALFEREDWTPDRLGDDTSGKRAGWWGLSESAEAFLDELVTWRELGYVFCFHRDDYAEYASLPDWARETLEEHESDERPHVYSLAEFEEGRTHDELWNAAQGQLRREGRIHNYLRMLWGKKILEWTESPRDALDAMIELNNKYALDGRDPNSYSGIFWCLGRFDRGWPERAVFGKVRCMTSRSTARKVDVDAYIARYAP